MQTSSDLERADEPYAARVAAAVLASFMQQPQDRKTMLRLLAQMLLGEPKTVLQKMVDPRVGVASGEEFFSLALVKRWLDENQPRARRPLALPEPEFTPMTDEERERCDAMWQKTKAELERATEAMRASGRITGERSEDQDALDERIAEGFRATQRDDPEARMRALANLAAAKPMHEAGRRTPTRTQSHE